MNNSIQSNEKNLIQEIETLRTSVQEATIPEDLEDRALRYIKRLYRSAKHGGYTNEFETIQKYIYWITELPWKKITQDNLDIDNAEKIMNNSHYGMNTVKDLILDYIAVMKLRQMNKSQVSGEKTQTSENNMATLRGSSANAPVMLFVGLQGVGKTSLAKSIAQAMGRKFVRISVGAIGSTHVLRGQSKAVPNAEPGQIIKSLVRTQTMNPVILLDEIDKASGNKALLNDIMATLLEILDPEQNSTFIDQYIDYPVNLSRSLFICTANNLGTISTALLDRMEVIRFTSYTDDEKEVIAKNYSLPKVLRNTGLKPDQLVIQEEVWPTLIRPVGFDAGLRQLERNLATIARRTARKILEGEPTPITVTQENIRDFVIPDQGSLS